MFTGSIESKINMDSDVFLEIRYSLLKEFPVKESIEKIRLFRLLEENFGTSIKYFLTMEKGFLQEGHILTERFTGKRETILLKSDISTEDIPSFLDKMMPFMGYIHWGIMPGGKRSRLETLKALYSTINTSHEIIATNKEIYLKSEKPAHLKNGIGLYASDNGFYYLGYLMGNMRSLEGAINLANKELDEERVELLELFKKTMSKNKVRLLLQT